MTDVDPFLQGQLDERQGVIAHTLVWLTARNRDTGLPETMGFWTGDDHQTFVIRSAPRLYFGAGAVVGLGAVRAGIGLVRRTHTVRLPPMLDETRQALRGYEPRGAAVEVHVVAMSITTGAPLAEPRRVIKGTLEGAPEHMSEQGGESYTELKIVTGARLAKGVAAYKSDAALRSVHPAERGREYTDLGESWVVRWSIEKR